MSCMYYQYVLYACIVMTYYGIILGMNQSVVVWLAIIQLELD